MNDVFKLKSYPSFEELSENNKERIKVLRKKLIEQGIIESQSDFIVISDEKVKKNKFSIRPNSEVFSLVCPPDNEHSNYYEKDFYHVSSIITPRELTKNLIDSIEKENVTTENQNSQNTENENKEESSDIIKIGAAIPAFAMIANNKLSNYNNFLVNSINSSDNSVTIKNDKTTLTLPLESVKEIFNSENDIENTHKVNNSENILESQYKDYFTLRKNTAANFRHNLSVYCRKEANSPLDSIFLAKKILERMPPDERKKTKELLQSLNPYGEKNNNELILDIYKDAVKEFPLNEKYLTEHNSNCLMNHRSFDTNTTPGTIIDNTSTLKIGDTIENVSLKSKDVFGHKINIITKDLKIISSSKESNLITFCDKDKGFYELPLDKFMDNYDKQRKAEVKEMNKTNKISHKHSMDIER